MSDSSYVAVTRHRRPFSTAGRPPVLELVDDDFAEDSLIDDEVDCMKQEILLAPLLDEEDGDPDAVLVTTGNSSSASANAAERRRRELELWSDLALESMQDAQSTTQAPAAVSSGRPMNTSRAST